LKSPSSRNPVLFQRGQIISKPACPPAARLAALVWPEKIHREIWLLCRRGVVFNQGAMSQTHPLTTTTFELPGYRVTKSFGVVRGIMVRSRSVIGNIGANIQSIFGGNITLYTNLCERAREDTFNLMLTHAGELGANAVIGVRYDATEIAPGITEVLCYGTAVYVEKA
jgi:uncharacterized protein YbjQ (UPF0145 family)